MPSHEQLLARGCKRGENGAWEECDDVVRKWWADAAPKMQKCTGARQMGNSDPTVLAKAADRVLKNGEATVWGFEIHPTPIQIHGGVALGANRAFLESAWKSEGRLLDPSGRLLFQNVNGDLHFWAFSDALGEHAVITGGEVKGAYAADGQLRIVVASEPGAAVRHELRAAGSEELPEGLEWVEVRDAGDGAVLLSKAAWQCGAGCIGVGDIDFDELGGHLDPFEQDSPGLRLRSMGQGMWVVQIDLGEVRVQIQEREHQASDTDARLAAARLFAQWGFEEQAVPLYEKVRKDIEGGTQDTIFAQALGRSGMFGLLGELIGESVEERQTSLASEVAGGHLSVIAAWREAKRWDRIIEQLSPEVAADLWDSQAALLAEWNKKAPPATIEALKKAQVKYTGLGTLARGLAVELPNPWE